VREGALAEALKEASGIFQRWATANALSLVAIEAAAAGNEVIARRAIARLDTTEPEGLEPDEYFAAAYAAAFARVAIGELGNAAQDLETLGSRMDRMALKDELSSAATSRLLALQLDALEWATGTKDDGAEGAGAEADGKPTTLFSEAFAAGTAFGFGGKRAGGFVGSTLAKIAEISDPQLRLALLVILGRQMQAREVLVGF
jgi:hypothetical protein